MVRGVFLAALVTPFLVALRARVSGPATSADRMIARVGTAFIASVVVVDSWLAFCVLHLGWRVH